MTTLTMTRLEKAATVGTTPSTPNNSSNSRIQQRHQTKTISKLRDISKRGRVTFSSPFKRLRRSNSAPPRYGRRNSLLREHYRMDPEKRIVLPGAPKYEADWARDAHDLFNLVVLIPVIVLNIMNWNWDKLSAMNSIRDLSKSWTGEWFQAFYFYTMTYFVADLLWITVVPKCVRSPAVIIQHHIATMLYMLIPLYYPELRFFMGAALSVELNTWFLISRRVFNKQGFPCWTIDLPQLVSIRIKVISIMFYVTWILIRVIIYPLLLWDFGLRYIDVVNKKKGGSIFNIYGVIIPLHSIFVILNLKWTHELIMSKIRYWKRGKHGKKDDAVSKGL